MSVDDLTVKTQPKCVVILEGSLACVIQVTLTPLVPFLITLKPY